MTPDLTCGERHVLQFITGEWQPASTIAAFSNRAISTVGGHLANLLEKGVVEKMWDDNLGIHYWRLRQDPGFHRASEEVA